MKKIILVMVAFLALLFRPAALAAPPGACQQNPNDGSIHICDPLDNGTTVAQQRDGGEFVAGEGWKVLEFGNQLIYLLGKQADAGRLEFWVKGLEVGYSFTNDNHHLFELNNEIYWPDQGAFWAVLRVWGPVSVDSVGEVKFSFGGEPCDHTKWYKDPMNWQRDIWYHVVMEYGSGAASLRIDDRDIAAFDYTGQCDFTLSKFHIPVKPFVRGSIDPPFNAIYANLSFVGHGAPQCSGPCDDDNPCTSNDRCEADRCAGTPVIDGAPCDDGDPATADTTCRSGMCVSQCSLPDPAGVSVLEDHTIYKEEPGAHVQDDSQLEIEGEQSGAFVAGFYLKFGVDVPQGRRVSSAKVNLYCDYPQFPDAAEGGGGEIYFVPDNNWSEDTITWNNRPQETGGPLDSIDHIDRGSWYELDVSPAVPAAGTCSFAVFSRNTNGGHYISKEGGAALCRQPYMTIRTEPGPAPDAGPVPDAGNVKPDAGGPAGDAGQAGKDATGQAETDSQVVLCASGECGSAGGGCGCGSASPGAFAGIVILAGFAGIALSSRRRRA